LTPQEISEYKMRWMRDGSYAARIHSDLEIAAKSWCKRNFDAHQWSFKAWTRVYEHTFYFEKANHSQQFKQEFSKWINQ
jgi:hypothetical protein